MRRGSLGQAKAFAADPRRQTTGPLFVWVEFFLIYLMVRWLTNK